MPGTQPNAPADSVLLRYAPQNRTAELDVSVKNMKRLAREQIDALNAEGYLFLNGFEPGISTFDVASKIGAIKNIQGISTVQKLRPKDKFESTSKRLQWKLWFR